MLMTLMTCEIDPVIQNTLRLEAEALTQLSHNTQVQRSIQQACDTILSTQGKVIVTGMGKSGLIASKIAATLSSTGSPALFLHAGDANHGDLGVVQSNDIILALSSSGHTQELLALLPRFRERKLQVIALSNDAKSPLAKQADFPIIIPIDREACPLDLAPTTSTTTMLAVGDAIAMSLLNQRQHNQHDFAWSHPAGSLGKQLHLCLSDIMHTHDELPIVHIETSLHETLLIMTSKRLGVAVMVNDEHVPVGIFTDGDLRRALSGLNHSIDKTPMAPLINKDFVTLKPSSKVQEALSLMRTRSITTIPVVQDSKIVGIVHMHDLLKTGIK